MATRLSERSTEKRLSPIANKLNRRLNGSMRRKRMVPSPRDA